MKKSKSYFSHYGVECDVCGRIFNVRRNDGWTEYLVARCRVEIAEGSAYEASRYATRAAHWARLYLSATFGI